MVNLLVDIFMGLYKLSEQVYGKLGKKNHGKSAMLVGGFHKDSPMAGLCKIMDNTTKMDDLQALVCQETSICIYSL